MLQSAPNTPPQRSARDETVDALFRRQVLRTPSSVALSFGQERITYAQLDGRANRWAHALRARRLGPEAVVGLLSERTPELVAAILGVFRVGAAYVPLSPDDPPERQARALRQSGAALLVTSSHQLETARSLVTPLLLPLLDLEIEQATDCGELPAAPGNPGSLAYVIFTSGSTGLPKGAMLEQRGLVNHLLAMIDALELTADDVLAQTASQCFDLSLWQMLGVLIIGGRTALLPDEVAHQPSALLRTLELEGVTVAELVPSVLRALCDSAARKADRRPRLGSLRWMISTGEPLSPSLCAQWFAVYPTIPLVNAYGPTECSDDVTLYTVRHAPDESAVPLGSPISHVQVHLLDEKLRPVAPGEAGELCVGGAGVGRGYARDPERTALAFIPDPVSGLPGARLYRTGDVARRRADGALEYLGRVDQQVKLRGHRIELGEVEAAISTHPSVKEALVVALARPSGELYLAAYITQREAASGPELLAHARGQLPEYMVPEVVVTLESFPLNASGKVDRRALPTP